MHRACTQARRAVRLCWGTWSSPAGCAAEQSPLRGLAGQDPPALQDLKLTSLCKEISLSCLVARKHAARACTCRKAAALLDSTCWHSTRSLSREKCVVHGSGRCTPCLSICMQHAMFRAALPQEGRFRHQCSEQRADRLALHSHEQQLTVRCS